MQQLVSIRVRTSLQGSHGWQYNLHSSCLESSWTAQQFQCSTRRYSTSEEMHLHA